MDREVRGISQEKGRHDQNILHIIFKIKCICFSDTIDRLANQTDLLHMM